MSSFNVINKAFPHENKVRRHFVVAQIRVLYWKEIPVQVQVKDEKHSVSQQLDERFQQGVDAISMFDGSSGNEEYLAGWQWGAFSESEGSAEVLADNLTELINSTFPVDFVARIRDMCSNGERNPNPGALDHWFNVI